MATNNKRSLHIAFLDFDDVKNPLLGAGQAKATVEVGKRLVALGHSVTVYCAKYPGSKDRIENGIQYRHVSPNTGSIRLNNFFYIATIPFIVPRIEADIIIECFTAPVSTLLSPLFTKIPVVGLPTSFDAERFSRLYHLPFWIIEKFGARLYSYFIALTPYLAQKMRILNPDVTIREIGQGVSDTYLKIQKKSSQHILYLGRLDMDQKGIDLLLTAFAKVATDIALPLVLAGDGPDKEKIKTLISSFSLKKKVSLVGFADEKKKVDLLAKSAFVVFPSRNEGFSLFSLEAIASGNRLVAFDIPSLAFAPASIARKVRAFDVDAYAQAILLESKRTNQSDQEKLKAFARTYSWDKVALKFEQFFKEIV